jgi:hypothetical protein
VEPKELPQAAAKLKGTCVYQFCSFGIAGGGVVVVVVMPSRLLPGKCPLHVPLGWHQRLHPSTVQCWSTALVQ